MQKLNLQNVMWVLSTFKVPFLLWRRHKWKQYKKLPLVHVGGNFKKNVPAWGLITWRIRLGAVAEINKPTLCPTWLNWRSLLLSNAFWLSVIHIFAWHSFYLTGIQTPHTEPTLTDWLIVSGCDGRRSPHVSLPFDSGLVQVSEGHS